MEVNMPRLYLVIDRFYNNNNNIKIYRYFIPIEFDREIVLFLEQDKNILFFTSLKQVLTVTK